MAVVVATTLVREAISKYGISAHGQNLGADHPLTKGLTVDDLALVTDDDHGARDTSGGKLGRDNGVEA